MRTDQRVSRATAAAMSRNRDRVVADFHTFVEDVEQLLKSASLLPGESLAAARARLEERVVQAKARLADAGGAVADTATRARDTSETYIREYPWTALGITLAVGALVTAWMLRRP